jgi:cysteine-rich repeat protein
MKALKPRSVGGSGRIAAAFLCATFWVASPAGAVEYGGVEFPQGASSFADAVLDYSPDFGGGAEPTAPNFTNPNRALGMPDYTGGPNGNGAVSLGEGGKLELLFDDNVVTNSGNGAPDLAVFEVGPQSEDILIALRPANSATEAAIAGDCTDSEAPFADGYCEVGTYIGSVQLIDLDAVFPGFSAGALRFDAIQIIDDPLQGNHTGTAIGADIDSVGGIASGSVTCGDGQVEGAEECDDGGTLDGDGCGSDCRTELCWQCDTGEPSLCAPVPALPAQSCNDGNLCTTDDRCDGQPMPSCIGGPPLDCDDGNVCTDDSCIPASGCAYQNNSGPCDDGSGCSENDQCESGACTGDAVVATGCRQVLGTVAPLSLKDRSNNDGDRLTWKWKRGEATSTQDFAFPTAGPGAYDLCVFDQSGSPWALRGQATAPKGPCGSATCWTLGGTGKYKYKNSDSPQGARIIILAPGEDEKARISVKGMGPKLQLRLPLSLPVKVQLRDTETGTCWETDYNNAIKNDGNRFKAK